MPDSIAVQASINALTVTDNPVAVDVQTTTNTVSIIDKSVGVLINAPQQNVTVYNDTNVLTTISKNVTLILQQNPVTISVIQSAATVVTAAIQGPQGVAGVAGVDSTSNEIIVLNKAEEKDTINDIPNAGDITVYYGIAAPLTPTSSPLWLITKQIYLVDGDSFDSSKKFASAEENQIWDNRLSLIYS